MTAACGFGNDLCDIADLMICKLSMRYKHGDYHTQPRIQRLLFGFGCSF